MLNVIVMGKVKVECVLVLQFHGYIHGKSGSMCSHGKI